MTDALCELRHNGDGTSPLAETLAKNIESRLEELLATVNAAVSRVEKSGLVNLINHVALVKNPSDHLFYSITIVCYGLN